ncbi:hypothetical protein P43SY_000588 [Pythium insidiosum]|uniref:Uncharacterized protein n=1 Tax=Pythium insidiosum TaxID=114742 RepID=A0AAD5Q7Q2_PYTIN|nr:hypothetical protein P43SY_000588 [Pythium insidiosum]
MATPLSTLAAAPAAGEMALLVMLPVDGLVMIIQTSPLRTIVELEDFIVAEFARVFPDRPALPTPIRIQKCMPLTLVADRRKHQATSDKSDRHSFVELSKTLQVGNAFQAMEQQSPNLSSTPSAVKSNELPKPATPDETAPPTDKPVKRDYI